MHRRRIVYTDRDGSTNQVGYVVVENDRAALVFSPAYQSATIVSADGKVVGDLGQWKLTLETEMPETALAVLPGRPLRDLIDLTGLITNPDVRIRDARQLNGMLAITVRNRIDVLFPPDT